MTNIAEIRSHEMVLLLDVVPMARRTSTHKKATKSGMTPTAEGTFVKDTTNEAFRAKSLLRPQLISNPPALEKRKKAESDKDYLPPTDNTEDTEEDVFLEKSAVPESRNKGS